MALKITSDCINCGACLPECPNNAIYEGGAEWSLGGVNYGTSNLAPSGATGFFSEDFYYIVPDKCTECIGFYDKPQCAEVCPVDCCVPDPEHEEDKDALLKKKEHLDNIGR